MGGRDLFPISKLFLKLVSLPRNQFPILQPVFLSHTKVLIVLPSFTAFQGKRVKNPCKVAKLQSCCDLHRFLYTLTIPQETRQVDLTISFLLLFSICNSFLLHFILLHSWETIIMPSMSKLKNLHDYTQ